MSSKVNFSFDSVLGVYYAGQIVSGTAELITERPKTIRSIYITVNGFVETRWQESVEKPGADGKLVKALETYTTTEIYYSSDKYVYGQSGGSQLELPQGKYVFPFQATIPPQAPTSFNGTHGQVKHEVTLTIDRAVRYNNIFKQCFTVILPNDLNAKPEHLQPLKRIEEKTFWWGSIFGGNKPMVMDVSTSYSAYVPGQKINFHIVLDNQADVQCQDVKVRLFKNVTYRGKAGDKEQLKTTEVRIADKHCGEVDKNNKAKFDEFLMVPPTTPTTMNERGPIRVSYTLRFIAKTFRLHGGGDLVVDFPLVIGTVPLHGSADDKGPGQKTEAQPNTNGSYQVMVAPTFQEDVCTEHFESNTYKPRYPVYILSAQPTNANDARSPLPSLYPRAADTLPAPSVNYTPNPVSPVANPSTGVQKAPPYPVQAPAAVPAVGNNFEVLGFSIPPGYQPTASAPADASGNIGWK
ncbi:PREDICTED: arrestin domain-containing protein 2 isoform X1 [Drosophila arizonae]|uniref:Arrestin domain-containing protein 2 isoform X1 n=1 Tax=Drosophila arizonae TaxID=7263 RepID=A0ABM1Q2Z3_DROAR|nr:PREDICTED: arrestin domain-containing protein 2 isoform X1 [Drosophila arizonae]